MIKITCQIIGGFLFLVLASVPGIAGDLIDNAVLDLYKYGDRVCYELRFALEKVPPQWMIVGTEDAIDTLEKHAREAKKAGVRGAVSDVPACAELRLVDEIGTLQEKIDALRYSVDKLTVALKLDRR